MNDRDDRDPAFDELVGALRGELDRKVGASRPLPDFAAMLERAHELDPTIVDERTLAQVRELPPLLGSSPRSSESFDDLAPFTAALRAQLDAGLAEHRARQIPPPRFVQARPLVRHRGFSWAAAIVLLLVGGAVSAMIGGGDPVPEGEWIRSMASELEELELDHEPTEPEPARTHSRITEPREAETALADEPDPALAIRAPQPRKRSRPKPESPTDPLAELDARAQALWRAGDADGAELLFHEIVERGGRGRWAELAYAELFSLAQRHPGAQRDRLWRDYLASFPKGRYAEDARAGLCRRANETERHACWTDYLARHPEGTYASEAALALGSTE